MDMKMFSTYIEYLALTQVSRMLRNKEESYRKDVLQLDLGELCIMGEMYSILLPQTQDETIPCRSKQMCEDPYKVTKDRYKEKHTKWCTANYHSCCCR